MEDVLLLSLYHLDLIPCLMGLLLSLLRHLLEYLLLV